MPEARFHHLDALRTFAILYGVLVHAATLGGAPGLRVFAFTSGFFRMGAFFVVSGFLAALMLRRLGARAFVRRRVVALGVPLAVGLVLLNPVTNWLVYLHHGGPVGFWAYLRDVAWRDPADVPGPGVWHLHLWFLVSLLAYALLAPAVQAPLGGAGAARLARRLGRLPPAAALGATALAVALACLALRLAFEAAVEPVLGGTPFGWLARVTLHYLPFFVVGMAMFLHPPFVAVVERLSLPAIAVGVLAVVAADRVPPGLGAAGEAAALVAKAFLTVVLIGALLALFRRWFGREGALSRNADAVYSVYLLHYLVIYALALALAGVVDDPVLRFALVSAMAIGVLLGLHRAVIEPSPALRFLLNGRPPSAGGARRGSPASPP